MKFSKQRGVSLIELMVSITIGLILMAGVLSIFFSSKITYFTNEKTARLQENGRVALDLVTHDVRTAGYMGCARTVPFTNTLNSSTALLWNYALPLQGYESDNSSAWTPTIAAGTLNPAPIIASDVIVTRVPVRDGRALRVESGLGSFTSDPVVLAASAVPLGTIMMITDCEASSVFQVTATRPEASRMRPALELPATPRTTSVIYIRWDRAWSRCRQSSITWRTMRRRVNPGCIGRQEPRSPPTFSSKGWRRCRSRMPSTPRAIASQTRTGPRTW